MGKFCATLAAPPHVCPELVEGLPCFLAVAEKMQDFDKLSPNGKSE
jgi:hypothetical protein